MADKLLECLVNIRIAGGAEVVVRIKNSENLFKLKRFGDKSKEIPQSA